MIFPEVLKQRMTFELDRGWLQGKMSVVVRKAVDRAQEGIELVYNAGHGSDRVDRLLSGHRVSGIKDMEPLDIVVLALIEGVYLHVIEVVERIGRGALRPL